MFIDSFLRYHNRPWNNNNTNNKNNINNNEILSLLYEEDNMLMKRVYNIIYRILNDKEEDHIHFMDKSYHSKVYHVISYHIYILIYIDII